MVYTGLKNKDKAFEFLERAFIEKDPLFYPLKTMPNWDYLYSDPRWAVLMKKMGLEG